MPQWAIAKELTLAASGNPSGWTRLLVVPAGVGGFVEVGSYDAFVTIRTIENVEGIAGLVGAPQQLGPAGSKCLIAVPDEGVEVQVQIAGVTGAGVHVDPVSGLQSNGRTPDRKVQARWYQRRPETATDSTYVYGTGGGEAAVPASSTGGKVFPPGYARYFNFRGVDGLSGYLLGYAGSTAINGYKETLGPSGSGYVSPWTSLAPQNTDAASAMTCWLAFSARQV